MLADDHAGRIEKHQRWPRPDAVLLPYLEIGIVDHRVLDPVSLNGAPETPSRPLSREFGRMDTDDDQLIRKLLFELLQLGKHVQTVDSAEGPEIENHYLAPEVSQAKWSLRVEPFEPLRKLWSANRSRVSGHQ